MAPRWLSRQSQWGHSVDSGPSRAVYLGVAATVFLVGLLIGFVVRGPGEAASPAAQAASSNSDVIDPTVSGVSQAENTADGAVKAATSFLSGFPQLALESEETRRRTLSSIVAPGAEATVQRTLQDRLTALNSQLTSVGPGPRRVANVVFAPATYRVAMPAPDRADVEIWYVQVMMKADGGIFEETWQTGTVNLVWTDRWRVRGFGGDIGPTPQSFGKDGKVSSYSDIFDLLKERTNPPSTAFSYRYALNK